MMCCPRCHGSGRVTDRVDKDPYGPVAHIIAVHGFCDCDAGWAAKAREIEAGSAAFEAHCAALAFADAGMSPPSRAA